MKIFSSILSLAFLSAALLACQKNDISTPAPAESKTNDISASPWMHQSSGIDLNNNGTIDAGEPTLESLGVPACRLDNLLTFKKDGTATSDEGATKCSAAEPQTTAFTWSFADNETNLVIRDNIFTQLNGKLKIKTLSATTFTLAKDTSLGLINATILLNLKH